MINFIGLRLNPQKQINLLNYCKKKEELSLIQITISEVLQILKYRLGWVGLLFGEIRDLEDRLVIAFRLNLISKISWISKEKRF